VVERTDGTESVTANAADVAVPVDGDREGGRPAETGTAGRAALRDDPDADPTPVLGTETLLDAIPVCVFVLSPAREVLHWNRAAEELCGTPREEVLGTDEVSVAFYQDGRRAMTLAGKVVEAPESADREYGVGRSGEVAYTRYEDTSTMLDAQGREVDI